MKKIIAMIVLLVAVASVGALFLVGKKKDESTYLRVHIRANSNQECDQAVKYEVKAAVVDFLTPKISEGSTFKEVYAILESNLCGIEEVANEVLKNNGMNYTSHAALKEEYFPTRSYGDFTLEHGYYDALILNLGTGEGNNWWCVVYPPLCFIGSEGSNPQNIVYKSKLVELINKFFK